MVDYTSRLFARPSFIEGMARIFDMGGTLNEYNASPSGEEADAVAMWSDWAAIGQDMYAALDDCALYVIEPVASEQDETDRTD